MPGDPPCTNATLVGVVDAAVVGVDEELEEQAASKPPQPSVTTAPTNSRLDRTGSPFRPEPP